MREILGRRRGLRFRRSGRHAQLDAALTCATGWQWPVVPGVGHSASAGRERSCGCPDPECVVPGAHPFDPGLLTATTDERMVRWWWAGRPDAPVVLATGGRAPCALSLPAVAGARALVALDRMGMRLGPVVATPTRWSLLVAPYSLERLGELLHAKDWVPSSLRFHGDGGYLVLPPSETGKGPVWWERAPAADTAGSASRARPATGGPAGGRGPAAPWLPEVEGVLDALVEASTGAPGGGSKLAY
ncbi:bifunctional DNA primase/polymerase [Streptomyces sp. NBC_00859]|uniref:bifunctional DNA primase/polymerase n=1 Tax=Streptomyces sp. NBC_00859 TaxID=2903682 RepID=UPI00386881EA|nr:bifunctional DNA primase/polymerase [Streptomyces sp. NBC_00859]